MSAIQSNIGLITGIPIQQTVDQLIAISAQPRNALVARTQGLQAERTAIDTLSALVLGLRSSVTNLRLPTTFATREATSSSDSVTATVAPGSTPSVGSTQFTPLQTAAANQFVSASFASPDDIGTDGRFTLQVGGQVDRGARLTELNGGAGFDAGRIRITDRSGLTDTIDLRGATTIDDVLAAINDAEDIDVTATTDGGRIVLTDNTGESGTFRVREVGSGTTAESLGLADLNQASDTLTGQEIRTVGTATRLSSLNEGTGVRITNDLEEVDDLAFTLSDGTTGGVDLSGAATLGDVVDAINNDEELTGLVEAHVAADGLRLEVQDLTAGAGTFAITNGTLGTTADDLGLSTAASGNLITGTRLVSGLQDTLVSSLGGGGGIGLGEVSLQDRAGGSAAVDLAGLETIEEVVDAINNASGVQLEARINGGRSGIEIVDTSGGTGNLVIDDVGTGTTAADLGIAIDAAADTVDGGPLSRATVGTATRLEDFNSGDGVERGEFRITDSAGQGFEVDLESPDEATTLGDVIDRINAAAGVVGAGVTARINDNGDGLVLTDTAGGANTLTVEEVDGGTTAADLRLIGESTTTNANGQQVIDGTRRFDLNLADLETDARAITLASLGGGQGIELGIFNVTARDGNNFTVDLGPDENGASAATIGDVIDRINAEASSRGFDIVATVNDDETGILLTDNGPGSGELRVEDLGGGSTASRLGLIRTGADSDDNQIDGAGAFDSGLNQGALGRLADEINNAAVGVRAEVFEDASGFRLALTTERTGAASELLVDAGAAPLGFFETSRARDAAALFGAGDFAVTSDSNVFEGVVPGVQVTVNQATGEEVSIDVVNNNQPIIDAVQGFVGAFNAIAGNLDVTTNFDAETLTTGILFGTGEALRVETDLARAVTGRFFTSAGAQTLADVGITINGEGQLSLNQGELEQAIADDPAAVQALFADEGTGLADQLDDVTDRLAGDVNSLLSSRSTALERIIDSNNLRITDFNESLDRERDALLLDFIRLEETVALLQSNLTAISNFQPVPNIQGSVG